MANTWGNNYWGINSWGEQDDVTLTVTGSSVSSSIGTSTTQANADVIATSLSLTITLQGAVAGASAEVSPIGLSMSVSTGEEDIGVGADVTGSSITTSITGVTIDALGLIGSGWGRDLWGSMAWGDAYSVQTGSVSAQTAITGVTTQANADVQAQGQSLTVVTGDEVPEANANVFPDGVTATTDIGEVQALRLQGIEISTGIGLIDIQAGGNVFLNVTEHTINTGIGLVEIEIAAEVFHQGRAHGSR